MESHCRKHRVRHQFWIGLPVLPHPVAPFRCGAVHQMALAHWTSSDGSSQAQTLHCLVDTLAALHRNQVYPPSHNTHLRFLSPYQTTMKETAANPCPRAWTSQSLPKQRIGHLIPNDQAHPLNKPPLRMPPSVTPQPQSARLPRTVELRWLHG